MDLLLIGISTYNDLTGARDSKIYKVDLSINSVRQEIQLADFGLSDNWRITRFFSGNREHLFFGVERISTETEKDQPRQKLMIWDPKLLPSEALSAGLQSDTDYNTFGTRGYSSNISSTASDTGLRFIDARMDAPTHIPQAHLPELQWQSPHIDHIPDQGWLFSGDESSESLSEVFFLADGDTHARRLFSGNYASWLNHGKIVFVHPQAKLVCLAKSATDSVVETVKREGEEQVPSHVIAPPLPSPDREAVAWILESKGEYIVRVMLPEKRQIRDFQLNGKWRRSSLALVWK